MLPQPESQRHVLVLLLFFILASCGQPTVGSQRAIEATPTNEAGHRSSVDCSADDLIVQYVDEIDDTNPRGGSTPEEALNRFFSSEPGLTSLSSNGWKRVEESERGQGAPVWVRMAYERNQARQGIARVDRFGEVWQVSAIDFCQSLAEPSESP